MHFAPKVYQTFKRKTWNDNRHQVEQKAMYMARLYIRDYNRYVVMIFVNIFKLLYIDMSAGIAIL